MLFDGGETIWRLADNAASRNFAAQLPLTQTFGDFNSIEKICRLEETVPVDDTPFGADPAVGRCHYL
ncbi:MAG: hypothetical protein HFE44_12900 [Oscillospiraceae bacterium]|nr:hypothetical protein [Oscillospiraceae bacterium]